MSVEEIFPTLVAGATLVIRPDELLDRPASCWDLCRSRRITVANLPTPLFHQLAWDLPPPGSAPEPLRQVLFGGDTALLEDVIRWRDALGPSVRLLNMYGPTETTVDATAWDLDVDLPGDPPVTVPLGEPLPNTRVRVLDDRLPAVTATVPGEI